MATQWREGTVSYSIARPRARPHALVQGPASAASAAHTAAGLDAVLQGPSCGTGTDCSGQPRTDCNRTARQAFTVQQVHCTTGIAMHISS